jgi:hypothetical protein
MPEEWLGIALNSQGDQFVANQPARLMLHINAGPEADNEERALFTRRLREHLLELNVDGVDQVHHGVTPAGAKACAPLRIDWAIVAGSDSRSGAGVSGEATPRPRERTPPGPSNRASVAIKWITRTARLRIEE